VLTVVAWPLVSGRDSELISWQVSALLAERETAERGDQLLRFVQTSSELEVGADFCFRRAGVCWPRQPRLTRAVAPAGEAGVCWRRARKRSQFVEHDNAESDELTIA
jgi:hypothetical protein